MGLAIAIVLGACFGASTPASQDTATRSSALSPELSATPTHVPGVTRVFDLSFRPSGIVAHGNLIWAEDHAQTNFVYAIDPDTGATRAKIEVTRPCDVVAAFDRIWVADLDAGSLLSIDPSTHVVDEHVSGLARPCGLQVVDDAIWLAVDEGLARVDPRTAKLTITKLEGAVFPGAGMPFWAARYDTGDLLRVDPASGDVQVTIPHPGGMTEGPPLAAGFGSLWVGAWAKDGLYRLDAATGTVEREIDTASASRLLVTTDGVWLTSYVGGAVERVDPTTDQVTFRAKLGGNINGIAEGFGSIWVTDTATGRLYRIDPAASGTTP
jgi:streptogramin lyase